MLHVEHWFEPDLPADIVPASAPSGSLDRLVDFAALVRKWNPKINLIARSTEADLWHRHIVDSAQILRFADAGAPWCDLGSGGGFPGLVVAIMRPGTAVTLVESDKRKAAFLGAAKTALGLTNVTIFAERIEKLKPQHASIVSARALAPLVGLLPLVARHIAAQGQAILMKGAKAEQEITEARMGWDFQLQRQSSITDPESAILILRNIQPCNR